MFHFHLFTGHQSCKPDVISQLEREEKLWMTEIQTQRGEPSTESSAAGVPEGNSPSFSVLGRLLSTQQPRRPVANICHIMPSTDFPFHSKRKTPKCLRGLEGPAAFARSPGSTILRLSPVVPLLSMLPALQFLM